MAEENTVYAAENGILYNKEKTVLLCCPNGLERNTVVIPSSVTTIEKKAFGCCEKLVSVTIPQSVTTIGMDIFASCTALTDVYYGGSSADWAKIEIAPDNDELNAATIHYAIESGTCGENLVWELTEDGVLTISGTGDMATWLTEEDIPWQDKKEQITEIYIEEGVTSISDGAFAFCAAATKVRMPSGLQSIGASAFSFCTALSDVILPSEGLVSIGDSAFRAVGVTRLDFREGLESIGSLAFAECTQLTYVGLPKSLHSYSLINPFYGCTSLEQISISMGNTGVCTDGDALYTYDGTILLCYPAAQSWAAFGTDEDRGLTAIGLGAFSYANNLKKVYLPDGVTQIWSEAFSHCSALTSIAIPATMQSIDQGAFVGCENLTEILFGGSEEEWNAIVIGDDNECLKNATVYYNTLDRGYVGENILWTYTTEGKMTISGTGEMIFEPYEEVAYWRYAQEVTALEIQNGITKIADYAFDGFNKITQITIPKSVTTIEDYAFFDCASLTDVYYGGSSLDWAKIDIAPDNDELEAATIHYAIESGTCGENLVWTLTEDGVLTISGTGMMTDWKYGSDVPWNDKKGQVRKICFEEGVQSIGTHAFEGFFMLEEIELGKSVIYMGNQAFYNCDLLTTVYIPENVLWIDAFLECDGLENIEVAEGNTEYSSLDGVLYDKHQIFLVRCPEGKKGEIKIPDSVFVIEDSAFYDCDYITNIVFGSYVIKICEDAFYECDGLTEIQLNGIVDIESRAFAYCSNLTRVVIGDSVESLGTYVFGECCSLTDVVIGKSLKKISKSTFAGCSTLEKIVIPDTVEKISIYAFETCFALHSITIGKSVSVIEEHAFTASNGLKDIYYNGSPSEWKKIDIQTSNEELHAATIHYAKTFSVTEMVQENEAVTVTVLLEEKPEEGVVMLASYDKDGRFIGFDKQSMPEGNTATLSVTAAEGGTYKTMLWQAVGALMPLSAAE